MTPGGAFYLGVIPLRENHMSSKFSKNIAPHVQAELEQAIHARRHGNTRKEFSHLENAHVLGQESTYWHVKVHWLMFLWALRNVALREILGQTFRIVGAATKTAVGLVPKGNTGGSNVSPFRVMPLTQEHEKLIQQAKVGV
jgi:hypothetical protein